MPNIMAPLTLVPDVVVTDKDFEGFQTVLFVGVLLMQARACWLD